MKRFFQKWISNNIIWIIFLMLFVYILISGLLSSGLVWLLFRYDNWSDGMKYIHYYYTYTLSSILVIVLYCWIFKKNRFILRSFLPAGKGKGHKIIVPEDNYEPTQNNTIKTLLMGLALGFVMNFFCIACAMIHGDIKLFFDFSASQIPTLLFAFAMVFVQGSSEELWCRGFMYERLTIHYPLWVAILANGVLFGLLHSFNDGASVLAIAEIAACGIAFSLVRWYTGSIWIVMGIHTMWNFTQNFLFGLPNSGLVSEFSVFHLDASNGVSNLIYDYAFGVEAALPSIFVDLVLVIIVLLLAKRDGRLGELRLSYEKKAALAQEGSDPVMCD